METIFRFLFVFKSERKIRVSQITAKVDYEIEAEINSRRSSMTAQKKSENKRASTTDVDDSDLVATWNVPMSDKVYKIEFEHGTTTGKRIVRVDGKEILRRDWMFKLVGREVFEISGVRCTVSIDAIGLFTYEYSLQVGKKTYERFKDQQKKALLVWHVRMGEEDIRVCLERETMDIWVGQNKVDSTGEFLDDGGTKTYFEIPPKSPCYVMSESSGNRHVGLVHKLYVNDQLINPSNDADES